MCVQRGGHTAGFLLQLVYRLSGDEFVLLELDDNVWPCVEGSYVQISSLDELHMKLAS